MIRVRPYAPETDVPELAAIFHDAVQTGTANLYTQAQRDHWSSQRPDASHWRERLEGLVTLVAEEDGALLGFMSMDMETALLDLAFVRSDRARAGIGAKLYDAMMAEAARRGHRRFTVEASDASLPFFLKRGWTGTGHRRHGEGESEVITVLMELDTGSETAA